MADHLQFSPVPPPAQLAPQRREAAPGRPGEDFAALLEGRSRAERPQEAAAEPQLGGLNEKTDKVRLRDLLDALHELEETIASGGTPPQELLDRVAADLEALGAALEETKGNAEQVEGLVGLAGLAATLLAPSLAPLINGVANAVADAATSKPPAVAAPDARAQELAAKFAGLAARIEGTSPDLASKLAALGERLASGEVRPEIVAQLRLTHPAGKPADTAAPPANPPATAGALPVVETELAAPAPLNVATVSVVSEQPDQPLDAQVTQAPGPPEHAGQSGPPERTPPGLQVAAAASAGSPAQVDPIPTHATAPIAGQAATPGTEAPRLIPAAYHNPQVNLPQVAFEIARQVQQGNSRFQIRLDPPELGRIDVRLDVDGAGNVHARLTVERSETLDMFQRDQRSLERALQQAGLDGGKTSLEFSLRQSPSQHNQQDDGGSLRPGGPIAVDTDLTAQSAPQVTLYRGTASAAGLNLFV